MCGGNGWGGTSGAGMAVMINSTHKARLVPHVTLSCTIGPRGAIRA